MKPRFEGQPALEAYGDGGFRLNGQRFEGSLIVTPVGVYPWDLTSVSGITPESLAPVVEAAGAFDFLIVGTGEHMASLPGAALARLTSLAIFPDVMATGPACRTYNLMLSENRRVAAALIAVA
ncbi:protein of unknown function DUF498 [Parvibaculum lavamentivorans DS-1]|uniref:Mth938-like domain-containing protein n=2 Tax=Parvibaculum lavamentivorans TaxID=256618 RepID=A7HXL2_PARL1|nr:protein of unknown function DUF498 [Parvibaculum lavamentivorans DS-1]